MKTLFKGWGNLAVVLVLMAGLLSACDLFSLLPSARNQPTATRRINTVPAVRTSTPGGATSARTSTPVRTATSAQPSNVTQVKSVFTSNTSFEYNLDSLNNHISAMASALTNLNSAKTALAVIDSIKSKTCVVSSCWTVLTTALDAVASGSGSALTQLDSLLRTAMAFKAKVDAVGSLTSLRSAASSFRSSSTSSTLSTLLSNLNAKLPALKALNQDLSTLRSTLSTIKSSVDMVAEALRTAKNIASIPYLSELTSAVDKVRVATNSAYTAVSNATSPLSSSVSVMDSILAASK